MSDFYGSDVDGDGAMTTESRAFSSRMRYLNLRGPPERQRERQRLHHAPLGGGHTDSNETRSLAKNKCIERVLLEAGANANAIWKRKDFNREVLVRLEDMTDDDFTLQLIRTTHGGRAWEPPGSRQDTIVDAAAAT
jgi:hypothetical protein